MTFTRATAEVQKRWSVGQLLLILALSALAGFLQGYFGYFIAYYFPRWWDSSYNWDYFAQDLVITIAYFITIIATFVAIARQGFTSRALATIGLAGADRARSGACLGRISDFSQRANDAAWTARSLVAFWLSVLLTWVSGAIYLIPPKTALSAGTQA